MIYPRFSNNNNNNNSNHKGGVVGPMGPGGGAGGSHLMEGYAPPAPPPPISTMGSSSGPPPLPHEAGLCYVPPDGDLVYCDCDSLLDPFTAGDKRSWRPMSAFQHYCKVCNTQLNSCKQSRIHVEGKKHDKRLSYLKYSFQSADSLPSTVYQGDQYQPLDQQYPQYHQMSSVMSDGVYSGSAYQSSSQCSSTYQNDGYYYPVMGSAPLPIYQNQNSVHQQQPQPPGGPSQQSAAAAATAAAGGVIMRGNHHPHAPHHHHQHQNHGVDNGNHHHHHNQHAAMYGTGLTGQPYHSGGAAYYPSANGGNCPPPFAATQVPPPPLPSTATGSGGSEGVVPPTLATSATGSGVGAAKQHPLTAYHAATNGGGQGYLAASAYSAALMPPSVANSAVNNNNNNNNGGNCQPKTSINGMKGGKAAKTGSESGEDKKSGVSGRLRHQHFYPAHQSLLHHHRLNHYRDIVKEARSGGAGGGDDEEYEEEEEEVTANDVSMLMSSCSSKSSSISCSGGGPGGTGSRTTSQGVVSPSLTSGLSGVDSKSAETSSLLSIASYTSGKHYILQRSGDPVHVDATQLMLMKLGKKRSNKNNNYNANRQPALCEVCRLSFASRAVLEHHLVGSRHARKVRAAAVLRELEERGAEFRAPHPTGDIRCEVCEVSVNSSHQLQAHLGGHRHKLRCARQGIKPSQAILTPMSSTTASSTPSEASAPVRSQSILVGRPKFGSRPNLHQSAMTGGRSGARLSLQATTTKRLIEAGVAKLSFSASKLSAGASAKFKSRKSLRQPRKGFCGTSPSKPLTSEDDTTNQPTDYTTEESDENLLNVPAIMSEKLETGGIESNKEDTSEKDKNDLTVEASTDSCVLLSNNRNEDLDGEKSSMDLETTRDSSGDGDDEHEDEKEELLRPKAEEEATLEALEKMSLSPDREYPISGKEDEDMAFSSTEDNNGTQGGASVERSASEAESSISADLEDKHEPVSGESNESDASSEVKPDIMVNNNFDKLSEAKFRLQLELQCGQVMSESASTAFYPHHSLERRRSAQRAVAKQVWSRQKSSDGQDDLSSSRRRRSSSLHLEIVGGRTEVMTLESSRPVHAENRQLHQLVHSHSDLVIYRRLGMMDTIKSGLHRHPLHLSNVDINFNENNVQHENSNIDDDDEDVKPHDQEADIIYDEEHDVIMHTPFNTCHEDDRDDDEEEEVIHADRPTSSQLASSSSCSFGASSSASSSCGLPEEDGGYKTGSNNTTPAVCTAVGDDDDEDVEVALQGGAESGGQVAGNETAVATAAVVAKHHQEAVAQKLNNHIQAVDKSAAVDRKIKSSEQVIKSQTVGPAATSSTSSILGGSMTAKPGRSSSASGSSVTASERVLVARSLCGDDGGSAASSSMGSSPSTYAKIRSSAQKQSSGYFCSLCDVKLNSKSQFVQHSSSSRHRVRARQWQQQQHSGGATASHATAHPVMMMRAQPLPPQSATSVAPAGALMMNHHNSNLHNSSSSSGMNPAQPPPVNMYGAAHPVYLSPPPPTTLPPPPPLTALPPPLAPPPSSYYSAAAIYGGSLLGTPPATAALSANCQPQQQLGPYLGYRGDLTATNSPHHCLQASLQQRTIANSNSKQARLYSSVKSHHHQQQHQKHGSSRNDQLAAGRSHSKLSSSSQRSSHRNKKCHRVRDIPMLNMFLQRLQQHQYSPPSKEED